MIIEDTFTIAAPVQKVWDYFLNIEQMAKCMPGADVRQTDPENFAGELTLKVGTVDMTFNGSVTITNQMPPLSLTASIKGKDKATGSRVQGEFTSSLKRVEPSVTEVEYKIDVTIRGKVGQLGQSVIQDAAKQISSVFLVCIKSQLETPEGETPPPPLSKARLPRSGIRTRAAGALHAARVWVNARVVRRRTSRHD